MPKLPQILPASRQSQSASVMASSNFLLANLISAPKIFIPGGLGAFGVSSNNSEATVNH
jgi:hypothetical protein